MNLEIHASPILAATINQIPKLHVQYAGQELGYITLPETNIPRGKGITILKFESPFTITNQDAFRTFNEDLITKAQFVWTLNAPVSVKILKMNFHKLSFNKKIVLKGKRIPSFECQMTSCIVEELTRTSYFFITFH